MNIVDFIYMLIGVVIGIIVMKIHQFNLQLRKRTVASVVLSEEQAKKVQELVESFNLEEKSHE